MFSWVEMRHKTTPLAVQKIMSVAVLWGAWVLVVIAGAQVWRLISAWPEKMRLEVDKVLQQGRKAEIVQHQWQVRASQRHQAVETAHCQQVELLLTCRP